MDYVNKSLSLTTNETSIVVKNLPSNTAIVTSVRTVIKQNGTFRFSNTSKEIAFTTGMCLISFYRSTSINSIHRPGGIVNLMNSRFCIIEECRYVNCWMMDTLSVDSE